MKSPEEILSDIDATIDQLIENSDLLKQVENKPLFYFEMHALQKTQESLIARLAHMQELLHREKKQEAMSHFSMGTKKVQRSSRPHIGRNRKSTNN